MTSPLTLNVLTAERRTTLFAGEQLILLLDGIALDGLLDSLAKGREMIGLLPTLAGSIDRAEAAIVERRFLPPDGEITITPLLMCPDDLDFSCTLVVTEAISRSDLVEWKRIGIDQSAWNADPELRIGQRVDWLSGIRPFRFARGDFVRILAAFDAERSRL